MKYVWGQSDEHPFQAQKKKQNEEQNEDEKHDDDSDCSVLMLSKTCWQKKELPAFCWKRGEGSWTPARNDPCPVSLKIGVVSPMTAAIGWLFLDPPRSLSSAMEDRTYGILELLSLQGQQNLQADLI